MKIQNPLVGKLILTSHLIVKTGLHIGGGSGSIDIGGLDKAVVRNPLDKHPYLPGSSIKGKMRAILERVFNKPLNRHGGSDTYRYESDDLESGFSEIDRQFIPFEGANTCPVSRIFGSTGNDFWLPKSKCKDTDKVNSIEIQGIPHVKVKGSNSPARLIVRDCHLEENSAKRLQSIDTGLYMTEWKFENGIDRITAAANPRQLERVPAGAKFNFELIYTVENLDQVIEDLKNIAISLVILEDDALGGHGSRGYGKVCFEYFQLVWRDLDWYKNPVSDVILLSGINDTKQLLLSLSSSEFTLPSNNRTNSLSNGET